MHLSTCRDISFLYDITSTQDKKKSGSPDKRVKTTSKTQQKTDREQKPLDEMTRVMEESEKAMLVLGQTLHDSQMVLFLLL